MKKSLLLSLFSLFLGIVVNAQTYRDVVYLKNGNIIKGLVVEQIPSSLKIEMADGSIFVYQMDEVVKVLKEEYRSPVAGKSEKVIYQRMKKYRGFMEMGGAFPIGDDGDGLFSIRTSHGYQFNPYVFLGGGIGLDYHFGYELALVPIFIDARFNFIDNPTTPYFDLKMGYSAGREGGFFMNPNMGVSISSNGKIGFTVGVGYNMQKLIGYGDYSSYSFTAGGININVGVEF